MPNRKKRKLVFCQVDDLRVHDFACPPADISCSHIYRHAHSTYAHLCVLPLSLVDTTPQRTRQQGFSPSAPIRFKESWLVLGKKPRRTDAYIHAGFHICLRIPFSIATPPIHERLPKVCIQRDIRGPYLFVF